MIDQTVDIEVDLGAPVVLEVDLGSVIALEVDMPSPPGPVGPEGPPGEDPRVGDLAALTTTVQDTIVSAINEVNMPSTDFTLLYENAKAG